MKIIIVGKGLIGGALADALRAEHEVIIGSRTSAEHPLDLARPESVATFFRRVGRFDGLACAAGEAWLGPVGELDSAKLQVGFASKLGGQLDLVLEGRKFIDPRGSFTLISGFLSDTPVAGTLALAPVNGAINAFVYAASAELRPLRINAVSPGLLAETAEEMGPAAPAGIKPVSLDDVIWAYRQSLFGLESGRVFSVHG
jgi:NAD(P)-dependent dehydrogenase (short-subunit alcohol dehydrogenase family)